jgi:hypothetical protein
MPERDLQEDRQDPRRDPIPQDENQYEDLQIPLGSIVLGAGDAVSLYIDLTTSGKKSEEFGNTFDQAAYHR